MSPRVDVVIPTCGRPAGLALTLTSLAYQRFFHLRVVVSNQTEDSDPFSCPEVKAAIRLLLHHGHDVTAMHHLPRRGMAEHRQFLLDQASAEWMLALDDDVLLETDAVANLVSVIEAERCGFVGSALIGLSFEDDVRPDEQAIELWDGPVVPETVTPGSQAWQRHRLHNAANVLHVQRRLCKPGGPPVRYRVAWVGGCVLYDRAKLAACGGFSFWESLPAEHCGEDVVAQLRLMAKHGGCGILPSGAYHQELPTTIARRETNAPEVLALELPL